MFFDTALQVIIGDKLVQTVHSVEGKNDQHEIGSSCKIVVPLACRISYVGAPNTFLTDLTKNLFKSGDLVTVTAWYYDEHGTKMPDRQLFKGFVYEFIEGTPMTIECLDNIYLLNQTTVNLAYSSITMRDLLKTLLKNTGITLIEPTIDLTLRDITFRLMSPAAVLEWLKHELGLNISLSDNRLYCNIASNIISTVFYDTGINVLDEGGPGLQKPEAVFLKLKVKAWFIQENGKKTSLEVGDPDGELREVFFYKIPFNVAEYTRLAGEALIKYKQMKFSGVIPTLLYPEVALFWRAQYIDRRYPDRNGNYTVLGVDFTINEHGFHQKIKLAFLSDIDSSVDALASTNSIVALPPL